MPAWICPPFNMWSDVDDFITSNTTSWGQVKGLGLTWRDVPVRTAVIETWAPITAVYVNDTLDQWKPSTGIWVKEASGWTPVVL